MCADDGSIIEEKSCCVHFFPRYSTFYTTNKIKYYYNYDRSLATVVTTDLADINPDQLLVSGVTDCDAADHEICVKAMRQNTVKKLTRLSCRRALADIKYSRDRVELLFVNYLT